MSSTRELFLSKQNLKENFDQVADEIIKTTGYKLKSGSRDPYRPAFAKMAGIIANKVDHGNQNLANLNNILINKSLEHFKKLIHKKKEQRSLDRENAQVRAQNKVEFSDQLGFSYMKDNDDMTQKYNELMQNRNRIGQTDNNPDYMPQPNLGQQQMDSRTNELAAMYQSHSDNIAMGNMNMPQVNPVNQPTNINTPLTMNEAIHDITNDIGTDMPLYNNIKDLQAQDETDPMKLVEALEKSRDINIENYNLMNITQDQMRQNIMNQGKRDIILERQNTDAITKIDQVEADPKKLFQNQDAWKSRLGKHVEENIVDNNVVSRLDDKLDALLLSKVRDLQISSQPDYFERTHYIGVSSADRGWETDSTDDTRYNFQVKFNANADFSGAGINNGYRNILSVELVSATLPSDTRFVAFDTRIYMGIEKYPYLLLKIEEFDSVFDGTNKHIDQAFATLTFDKFYNSEVLSANQITSNINSQIKTNFSNEFKRGFVRYNPAYFEKKKFYNAPLASLNKMTIDITDPRGYAISAQPDVLAVTSIAYTAALSSLTDADYELNPTHSFPYVATSTRKMIAVTTTKYFSNRVWRIGDVVQFKNFTMNSSGSKNSNFVQFITRNEGHPIINLPVETDDESATANNGQLNIFYIAPPGDLDSNNQTLDTSTYYDEASLDFTSASYGSVINLDMQTSLLFRIVTRAPKVDNLTKPMNV